VAGVVALLATVTVGPAGTVRAQPDASGANERPGEPSPSSTTLAADESTAVDAPSSVPSESLAEQEQHPSERDRMVIHEPDDDEDERNSMLWLEVRGGGSYVDVIAISQDNFIPDAERMNGFGPGVGAAAGFKLFLITIGGRATFAALESFDLGTIAVDLGLRIPTPIVEPYVRAGLGYAWLGNADYGAPSDSDTSVFGLMVDAGIGVDFYLAKWAAIGFGLDGAFLNMSRQSVLEVGNPMTSIGTVNFEEDGDAAGLALRAAANIRLEI
jgi:hypothetical protein